VVGSRGNEGSGDTKVCMKDGNRKRYALEVRTKAYLKYKDTYKDARKNFL